MKIQRGPRHFHLLFDEEIDALRPILQVVLKRMDEVIDYWYQLYVIHFGDDRTLGELDFTNCTGQRWLARPAIR